MDTSFPSAYRVMLVVDAALQSAASATAVTVDDLGTRSSLASGLTPNREQEEPVINSEPTTLPVPNPAYGRLALGTAPDSWGIWFPDDPQQPHWARFSTRSFMPASGPSSSARSATCPRIPNSSRTNWASAD